MSGMNAARSAVSVLSCACAVALAGCDSGSDGGTATPPPASTETTGANVPLEQASTDPVVVSATMVETALLTDVRAARHGSFDRVVFEFRNGVPGYDVRYVARPVTADGSGAEIEVAGSEVLQIRMESALDADLTKESAPRTYTGPTRLDPDTPQLAEVVRTGGFEGVLTWVAGTRSRAAFRVTTLESPPRLVIDLRNG